MGSEMCIRDRIRGPQASRIGANALAGLIYITTNEPTNEFEGKSELSIGNYNTSSLGTAFGGPLTADKTIKFRLAIRQDKSDGFRKNLYLNKSNTSRKDEKTLRLKIDFDLSEQSNSKLLLSRVDMDCLLYTSPSPRDLSTSRMPSSA